MKKAALLLISLSLTILAFSEDHITLKNGKTVDCKITKMDSANVYISIDKNNETVDTYISRKEIQSMNSGDDTKLNANSTSSPKFIKNRIALTLGYSTATGDFGSTDFNNSKAGLASSGAMLNLIYYTHKFTPSFGIGIKWFGVANTFETSDMCNYLYQETKVRWNASEATWSSGGILAGIIYTIPNNNLTWEFILLGGPILIGNSIHAFS
jgi:hypothetical protein